MAMDPIVTLQPYQPRSDMVRRIDEASPIAHATVMRPEQAITVERFVGGVRESVGTLRPTVNSVSEGAVQLNPEQLRTVQTVVTPSVPTTQAENVWTGPHLSAPPSLPVQARPAKKTITIGGTGYPRMRLKVDYLGISDTAIMFGFIDSDDVTIVEPPVANHLNPLEIQVGDRQYQAVYGGWSVTVESVVWVVMILVLDKVPA